jgi:hypothetical protein
MSFQLNIVSGLLGENLVVNLSARRVYGVSTQMLVFRNGEWRDVPVNLTDPLFSEAHRLQAAAIIATAMEKLSVQAATSEAERILYKQLSLGETT